MKNGLVLISILAIGFLASGCERETAVQPEATSIAQSAPDPELIAGQLVARAGWAIGEGQELPTVEGGLQRHFGYEREVLTGDIVHYSFQVRVGPGEFDVIAIHRVVKERRPYRPIQTPNAVFMVHGIYGTFEGFMFSSSIDRTAPVFLAQQDVDVWGIDLAWSLVPQETSDFSFMEGWGVEKDADHLGTALAITRFTRLLTGSGWKKVDLLGWSMGARTAIALLNEETQCPEDMRQVKGYLPVDGPWVVEGEEARQASCEAAEQTQANIDTGTYEGNTAVAHLLIDLARSAPDDPSPVFPWLTNRQAALFMGSSDAIFGGWHMVAGIFDPFPMVPVDLQYTQVNAFFGYVASFTPYMPEQVNLDLQTAECTDGDVPWLAHMAEITVPVMYVGAAGGIGDGGVYATTRLGSTDVSIHIVQLHPPDESALDFGHVDIFTADNAVELVFQPIADWVLAHSGDDD